MIKRIKNPFNTEEKKRLLSNFFSLSVLQGANYILPLITFPYLVRVLGVKNFGLLAFANATIAYFNILTDYGFSLTATREVSIHRDNKEKLIEIFSSVMTIKFVLMLMSFLLLSVLVFSFDKFRKDALIYFLSFGVVVGNVLFPVWFFQGMERMKYITFLNILAKTIFTVAIFIFVQKQSDVWKVPLLSSIGFLLAGIWALYLVGKEFGIDFKIQMFNTIRYYFKKSWYVFLSQLKISLFSNSNTIILGFLTNNIQVGYFSIAEKIIRALAAMQTPIVGALFPHVSQIILKDKEKVRGQLKKIMLFGTIFYMIILLITFIFSKDIILFLFGSSSKESVTLLRIMIVIPWTIFLNNIFGTQILLNTKRDKVFFAILLVAGIANLIICSLLTYFYSAIGTAIAMLLIEIGIMLGMYYFAKDFLNASKY